MVRNFSAFFISIFLWCALANAAPSNFSYQGQIIKPNGQPLEGNAVTFTIEVLSPLPSECVLYAESHFLNMNGSNGIFNIEVGSGTQSGGDYEDLATLSSALNNSTGAVTPTNCVGGPTYTPVSGDGRQLRITFDDGSGPNTLTQNHQIVSVPYADSASSIDGLAVGDLLIQDTSGSNILDQSNLVWLFETTRYAELQALINGTSSNYLTSSPSGDVSMNSQKVVNVADPTADSDASTKGYADGNIGGQTVDSATIDVLGAGDAGEVLVWNGTQWTSQAPAGDTSKLPLAGGTMTGDIDMNSNNITNANTVSASSVGANSVAIYNGANYMGFQAAPGSADLLWVLPAADGSANQALSTDASGNLSWRSFVESASNQGAGGVGPYKQLSSGDLEFKNINAGSNKVTVTDDAGNDEIDIDVDESNFDPTVIPNTAGGDIAATNVQGAINELDSEKVAKAGDAMTGSLTMNAQNEIRFADADSSNYVGFVAPATVAADLVWTLPDVVGGANQVLESDGTGNLQWRTIVNGSDVMLLDGTQAMSANMNLGTNRIINVVDPSGAQDAATKNYVDTEIAAISTDEIQDADNNTKVQVEEGSNDDTIRFDTAGAERMVISAAGNVGIGTSSPSEKLEVAGNVNMGTSGNKLILYKNGTGDSLQDYIAGGSSNSGTIHFSARQGFNFYLDSDNQSTTSKFSIFSNDTQGGSPSELLRITEAGNVGVGIAAPNSLLQIAGDIQIGTSAEACAATKAGAMRFAGGAVEFCDGGGTWEAFGTASGGEVNTASNLGAGGIGLVLAKSGSDLPFKSINVGSNKVTVTNDAGNSEVDIDVDESNFDPSVIPNTAAGTVSATNVQAAINELDTEKVAATRTISTAAGSGLQGGGDLSADRSLSLNIPGVTDFAATIANDDTILVYDTDATTMLEIQRSDFVLSESEVDAYANDNGYAAETDVMLLDGTQAMSANLNMGTNRIINLVDPSGAQDAATRNYVDTAISGFSSSSIEDADSNTMIQVEEGSNDDTIRFDTAGTERAQIGPTGNMQIGSASMTSGNPTFSVFGYDTGDTVGRYGRLSVDTAGNFSVRAEDNYLILDSNSWIQTQKPLNMIAHSILQSGNPVIGSADTGATLLLGHGGATTKVQIGGGTTANTVIPNGNVGVGTGTPAAKLHAYTGSSSATANTTADDFVVESNNTAGLSILSTDANSGVLAFGTPSSNMSAFVRNNHASDLLEIGTNNPGSALSIKTGSSTEAIRISSSGNVGIGTDGPSSLLDIQGVTGIALNRQEMSGGNRAWMTDGLKIGAGGSDSAYFGMKDDGANAADTVIAWGDDVTDNLRFIHTQSAGPVDGDERMRITAAGLVGIGTDAPDVELDVNTGTINAAAICDEDNANCIDLDTFAPGTGDGDFLADGSIPMTGELELLSENDAATPDLTFNGDENTGLFQPAADEMAFSNAGAESVRIDASGNVGIGSSAPTVPLDVVGTAKVTSLGVGIGAFSPSATLDVGGNIEIAANADISTGGVNGFYLGDGNDTFVHVRPDLFVDGSVGIGTDTPSNKVEIEGAAAGITVDATSGNASVKITSQIGDRSTIGLQKNNLSRWLLESEGTSETGSDAGSNFAIRRYDDTGAFSGTPLWIERATGNVGIGTDAPGVTLDVDGGVINAASICDENNANCLDLDTLTIGTGDFMADGSVPMTGSLQVGAQAVRGGVNTAAAFQAPASSDTRLEFNGTRGAGGLQSTTFEFYNNATQIAEINALTGSNNSQGELSFLTNNGTLTEAMRIDEDGNVGIGTTSPTYTLDVAGDMGIDSYVYHNGDSGQTSFGFPGGHQYRVRVSNRTAFYANNVGTMYVAIGDTTEPGATIRMKNDVGIGSDSPRTKLDVAGAIASAPAQAEASDTIDFANSNFGYTAQSCGAATLELHNMKDGATYTMAVQGTASGTCAFNAYSDAGSTPLTVKYPPSHGATTGGTETLYSFVVIGSSVYVAWVPGYTP